jgi:hypothetical protein
MPTTTTGFATQLITFSRGSLATVTDADGRIKWAPHNLLLASEQFDASVWTKSTTAAATVTANTATAPNSTTTADRVVGAAGLWFVKQNISQAIGQKFTFGLWVKSNIGSSQTFRIYGDETATISSNQTATTAWQLFTIEFTASQAGSYAVGIIADSSQTAADLLVWGGYCYRSDLGGMQANTSAYPLYNPTTAKNLLGFSEDFSNAYWNKLNILAFGSGSFSNALLSPNGLQTADLIIPDTTSGTHVVYASVSSAGNSQKHSIYVKPNGYTKVALREDQFTGASVAFLLSGAGSVLATNTSGGLTPTNPEIAALSDGWYRISTTFAGATPQRFALYILPDSYTSGSVTGSWTPNGTSGIYLWGAQLSDSASLDPYVASPFAAPVAGAYHGPRRDFDPSSLACRGLLVEEQRTNLLRRTNAFTTAPWQAIDGATLAQDQVGPDGVTNSAWTITDSNASAASSVFQPYTVANDSKLYVGSLFFRKTTAAASFPLLTINILGGSQAVVSGFTINTNTGVATASTGNQGPTATCVVTDYGTYWRVEIRTANNSTGNVTLYFQCFAAINTTGNGTSNNATTGSTVIYGAQLEEAASFATSYIPTGASTVTRSADVASVATSQFPYSASASSLVVSAQMMSVSTSGGFRSVILLSNETSSNRIGLYNQQLSTELRQLVVSGGSTQSNVALGSVTSNTTFKVGTAVAANDTNAALNGTLGTPDTTVTMPAAATMLTIGTYASNQEALNGWIRQITYLPRRISDSELQARTV